MGGVRQEAAQTLLVLLPLGEGLLDVGEHGVERLAELGNFGGSAFGRDPLRQVAGGDGASSGRHLLERSQAPSQDQPRPGREDGEQAGGDGRSMRSSRCSAAVTAELGTAITMTSPGRPEAGDSSTCQSPSPVVDPVVR